MSLRDQAVRSIQKPIKKYLRLWFWFILDIVLFVLLVQSRLGLIIQLSTNPQGSATERLNTLIEIGGAIQNFWLFVLLLHAVYIIARSLFLASTAFSHLTEALIRYQAAQLHQQAYSDEIPQKAKRRFTLGADGELTADEIVAAHETEAQLDRTDQPPRHSTEGSQS